MIEAWAGVRTTSVVTVVQTAPYKKIVGLLAEHKISGMPVVSEPKARVDIVVADERVDAFVSAIAKSANTGSVGDGKI